jgi:hypothetical protein
MTSVRATPALVVVVMELEVDRLAR